MNFKRLIIILTSLITLGFSSSAQDTSRWRNHGEIALNGNFANVNSNIVDMLSLALNQAFSRENYRIDNLLNYSTIHKDGKQISNELVYRLQFRIVRERWSSFAYQQTSILYSRHINLRSETALGTGTYLYRDSNFYGTASYALLYSNTIFQGGRSFMVLRNSLRLQSQNRLGRASLFLEAYYQPAVNDLGDRNYSWMGKLSTPITDKLAVNLSSVGSYEQVVYPGTAHFNEAMLVGVSYKY